MTPSLPEAFAERLAHIFPSEYLRVLASLVTPRVVSFRINTLRASPEQTIAGLKAAGFSSLPLPWPHYGFAVPSGQKRKLTESIFFSEGHIYIQNPASMLAAEMLAPVEGQEVLDLCAAPGGKTSHMAMLMNNRGRIAAVEPVKARYFRLLANLHRLGVDIVRCYRMDGRAVGRKTPGRFERILVDAPCSSEARFRCDDPESFAHWSPRKIEECARKQKRLLLSAADALKPGGRLLYCTCSFAPEENEAVVHYLLQRRNAMRVVPLSPPAAFRDRQSGLRRWRRKVFDSSLALSVRLLPNQWHDGFYMCLLEKTAFS